VINQSIGRCIEFSISPQGAFVFFPSCVLDMQGFDKKSELLTKDYTDEQLSKGFELANNLRTVDSFYLLFSTSFLVGQKL
jgi:hypothetical protein